MAKNKLHTKGYLRKMLSEKGLKSEVIIDQYPEDDIRYWTMVVHGSVILTCMKTESNTYFRIFGPNDESVRVDTQSGKVLIPIINNMLFRKE